MFYDILEQKNAFPGYKNKNVKKSKNWDFSKGVNPWFWQKIAIFPAFFLGNIGRKNMFNHILEPKNDIVRHKNKNFKQSKNGDFFKGVNPWFWSKNGHFFTFFLANIGQENVFYDILELKNRLFRLKKQQVQTVEKLIFFQRG